MFKTWWTRL
jgi:hypothetical protein